MLGACVFPVPGLQLRDGVLGIGLLGLTSDSQAQKVRAKSQIFRLWKCDTFGTLSPEKKLWEKMSIEAHQLPVLEQSRNLHPVNNSSSYEGLFHAPDTLIHCSELVCSCQWLLLSFDLSLALHSALSPLCSNTTLHFLPCFAGCLFF